MSAAETTVKGFSLDSYLDALTTELLDLHQRRLLPNEAITDGKWNRNSWLHSRVFGCLIRAVQRPLAPLVEVSWSRNFCPDLCIINPADTVQAVIEYESTNSSDERLFGKDIRHFEEAILAKTWSRSDLPPWWVLISTLPTCPVKNWPWYEWNTSVEYAPVLKDRHMRNEGPLRYYESHLHLALAGTWSKIASAFGGVPPVNLAWVNLDERLELTMKNLNGQRT